jgi:glyoxylase-like metal-dependent hydrolase (beta-lactamase superfamily II)/8-oxo-dGTP pyrophosphatase MutT (NUDIX family)
VTASPIARAASTLLVRGDPPELFLVRRTAALRFFGGFWVFPGGKVGSADRLACQPASGAACGYGEDRIVAAARELFEEAGVLLARRADGSFPPGGQLLGYLRRRLVAGELSFAAILSRLRARLHPDDFRPVGCVTTPAFVPTRFDTAFFLTRLPSNQQAEVWPGELDAGLWATPAEALARWAAGAWLVSPPTVMILQGAAGGAMETLPDRLGPGFAACAAGAIHPIYFAPAVRLIPLHAHGLPPSTHTNAYLVGTGPVYLIDPGAVEAEEQARLFAVLDGEKGDSPPEERGQSPFSRVTAVILSHHHPDHIGAAEAVARRYDVPIWGHPLTAERLRGKVAVEGRLQGGDRLDLGPRPDGHGRWHLEVLHTPGHAPGHLAFYEPFYRLLFVGDMISTLSSVVIGPPDGDLAVYLEQLRRLRSYDSRLLLPSHGGPSSRPAVTIDAALAHRRRREGELLRALSTRARTPSELTRELYQGLAPALVRFAELQVVAGLTKLRADGRAVSTDGRWSRVR